MPGMVNAYGQQQQQQPNGNMQGFNKPAQMMQPTTNDAAAESATNDAAAESATNDAATRTRNMMQRQNPQQRMQHRIRTNDAANRSFPKAHHKCLANNNLLVHRANFTTGSTTDDAKPNGIPAATAATATCNSNA